MRLNFNFFDNWWERTKGGAEALANDLGKLVKFTPIGATVQAAQDAMTIFKKKAVEWYQEVQILKAVPDSSLSPQLLQEKHALVNRANSIINKVQLLGINLDDLQKELGAIPAIAAVGMGAVAGLMLYWTYDFIKFKNKLAEYKTLREAGTSHADALNLIKNLETKPLFSGVSNIVKWGAIGVGAMILINQLTKKR